MIWLGIDLGDARTGVAISVSGSMTRSYRLIEGKGFKKTAIEVAEARGVILLAAQRCGVPVFEYTPLQVKSAVTGFGQAQKPQVMEMTRRLLRLQAVPKPDDTADALAIAICHAQTGGTALKLRIMKGR